MEEANKFYAEEIKRITDEIDRTDILIYIYKCARAIFEEQYPEKNRGVR